jgi:hypothetical protein
LGSLHARRNTREFSKFRVLAGSFFFPSLFTIQNILESIAYINHDSKLASYNLALQSFIAELLKAYSSRNKLVFAWFTINNVNCDN